MAKHSDKAGRISVLPAYKARARKAACGMGMVAVGTLSVAAPTWAADAAAKDDTLEEVIVTGIKKSVQAAQDIKRKAEEVVDSVSAQDIGALPDRSVSEALQRIPGITLQRTNANRDPARLASEGGGVFVRGLSWVRSELNGRDIFSANDGRALGFEDVSADLMAGVDVYKNPSADHVEGGIGGIVDLRTRKPFDQDRRIAAASFDVNYADLRKMSFLSGNALYSDSWQTGIGRIGFLGAVSIGNIGNRTDSLQLGRFDPHVVSATDPANPTVAVGQTVYIPNSIGERYIDWQQRRTAFNGVLQWAPGDTLTLTANAFVAKADPHDIEHAIGNQNSIATADPSYRFDSQGVFIGGTVPNPGLYTDVRYGENHYRTSDFSLNASWKPTAQWTLDADAQYVSSTADLLSLTVYTTEQVPGVGGAQGNAYGVTSSSVLGGLAGNHPTFDYTSSITNTDPGSYFWDAAMDHVEKNDASSKALKLDAEYAFDDNPWLRSVRFGVRATDKDATTRGNGWNWHMLSQGWAGGTDALNSGSTPPSAIQYINFDNFFRGDYAVHGAWMAAPGVVSNGTAYAYSILKATEQYAPSWAGAWQPTSTDFAHVDVNNSDSIRGINQQQEKTQAAHLTLRFAHGTPIGAMDGNVGVRVVHTANETAAIPGAGVTFQDGGACPPATNPAQDCTWYNAAQAFANAFRASNQYASESYNDVLPSLNVRFLLRDDLQWRLGASRGMTRPSFGQMSGISLLTIDNTVSGNPYIPNPSTANNGLIGSAGNPHLKPTRADNLDTSLEWYFAPASSLTAALFYKDITNYIYAQQNHQEYSAGGQTLDFLITQNVNGKHGVVRGGEFGYTQFFTGLPGALSGLGVQVNYTYVDSSGGANPVLNANDPDQTSNAGKKLPLEGLSKHSYNVVALYERYGVSARLAYNWRDRYLLTTSAANIKSPVWFEDYGQLDGSVFYSLNEHVKVGVQATNLLNSKTYLDVSDLGLNVAPRYSWSETDRRFAAAIRVLF